MMPERLKELQDQVAAWKQELQDQDGRNGLQDAAGGVVDESATTHAEEVAEDVVEDPGEDAVDLLEAYTKRGLEMANKPTEAPKEDPRIAELLDTVRSLKAELEEVKTRKASEPVDVDLDPEFVEEFPDLAKQIKKASGIAAAEAKREAEALKKQLEEIKGRFATKEHEDVVSQHQKFLHGAHPDINEFFPGGKYAAALGAWAMEQPVEFRNAIGNPLEYSPEYVSFVLGQFKSQVLKSAVAKSEPKKPASGDVAISVKSKATKIEPTTGPTPLSAEEMRNIHTLAEKYKNDPKKLNELRERLAVSYGGK